jgi:maleylacetate reductase
MTGIVSGTRMGASHAIGHVLGGSAGVPHGYTSCVMLPAVLAFNAEINGDRQAEISAALGAAGQPVAEVLDRFIAGLGLPRRCAGRTSEHSYLKGLGKFSLVTSLDA